jgi:hypothetical protein
MPALSIPDFIRASAGYASHAIENANDNKNTMLSREEAKALPQDLQDNYANYRAFLGQNSRVMTHDFASSYISWVAVQTRAADQNQDGLLEPQEIQALPVDLQDNAQNYLDHVRAQANQAAATPGMAALAQEIIARDGKIDLSGLQDMLTTTLQSGPLSAEALDELKAMYFDSGNYQNRMANEAKDYLADLIPFGAFEAIQQKHLGDALEPLKHFERTRKASALIRAAAADSEGQDILSILGGARDNVDARETGGDTQMAKRAPPIAYMEVGHDDSGYYLNVDVVAYTPASYPQAELARAMGQLQNQNPELKDVRLELSVREPITDSECTYFYDDDHRAD